jgi:hypothetical protein
MNPVYRFLHVTEVYLRLLLDNLPARVLEKCVRCCGSNLLCS